MEELIRSVAMPVIYTILFLSLAVSIYGLYLVGKDLVNRII